jgi:sucrose-phosphate synthase
MTSSKTKRVLVCDIDGTLLKNKDEETIGLTTFRLYLKRHRDHFRLVYATGRTFEATMKPIERGLLPEPDAVASLVGTEIWFPSWHRIDISYIRYISQKWDRRGVARIAGARKELAMQPAAVQSEWKLSYYLKQADAPRVMTQLRKMFSAQGIEAKLIYSCGCYLDIIPVRSGKAGAVRYIKERWSQQSQPVLACGDSGNDLDMLFQASVLGVAVGNAEQRLRKQARKHPHLYGASHPYAAGVLEGGRAHRFWPCKTYF